MMAARDRARNSCCLVRCSPFLASTGLAISELPRAVPELLIHQSAVPELTSKPPLNSQNSRPCSSLQCCSSLLSSRPLSASQPKHQGDYQAETDRNPSSLNSVLSYILKASRKVAHILLIAILLHHGCMLHDSLPSKYIPQAVNETNAAKHLRLLVQLAVVGADHWIEEAPLRLRLTAASQMWKPMLDSLHHLWGVDLEATHLEHMYHLHPMREDHVEKPCFPGVRLPYQPLRIGHKKVEGNIAKTLETVTGRNCYCPPAALTKYLLCVAV